MSKFALAPASCLHTLILPISDSSLAPGVVLAEQTGLALCSVLARKGKEQQLAERVKRAFDVQLPSVPRCTRPSPIAFVWTGPGQWLALAEGFEGHAFEVRLRSLFANAASVVDQSDGRIIVRVSGTRARDALAKGLLIDLHPDVFAPGCAAATTVAQIGVHFWQIDETPIYEFAVFRSFAVSFGQWLSNAAAEYGVSLVPR